VCVLCAVRDLRGAVYLESVFCVSKCTLCAVRVMPKLHTSLTQPHWFTRVCGVCRVSVSGVCINVGGAWCMR
jgi:hypothetical protein